MFGNYQYTFKQPIGQMRNHNEILKDFELIINKDIAYENVRFSSGGAQEGILYYYMHIFKKCKTKNQ